MTAKVNLLPQATRAEGRQGAQRGLAAGLVVLVLVGLGLATWWQRATLSEAEDELAQARAEQAEAQAAVDALVLAADLERQVEDDRALIVRALSDQVSLAGILQDVSLVMPQGADVANLTVNLTPIGPVEEGTPPPRQVGSLTATGESIDDISPGIERLILQFERPAGFRNAFVTQATTDEEGVTSYNLELQLGPEHRTERYTDGLPEVDR